MRNVRRSGSVSWSRTITRAAVALVTAVAGVALLPPAPAGAAAPTVVSLVFNDGLSSQYRNAAPLLEQHGVDGTFYVASNWVKTNDARYMRFYHLDELYRQGNEIGGMGKDHRNLTATYDTDPAADLAYKRDQVCGDFQALTDWGYHPASFTYPGGATNAQVQEIVRDCGFLTGRLPGGLSASGPVYAEPVPPAQPLALRSATTPGGPLTLATLQNAVTAAGENTGGWLPIAFNHVCSSVDADYSTCMGTPKAIDSAVLSDFLDWLVSQESEGITVQTVGEVMGAPHPALEPRPFVVTLTFDDGLRSQYGLREIFARHGVHGTFYINSGAVDAGEAGTMTWAQIRDLQAAGHDIGGHTTDHVNLIATDTTYDYKWDQTCADRRRLFEEGFNPVSFAFPFGAMNADASALVRGCGYQSARKAGTVTSDGPIYSETIPVTENPWAIRILGTNYNGPVTLEALQYAVNQARKYGGSWLPTLYHQVCYTGTPAFSSCMAGYRPVSDVTLDQFLGWVGAMADQNVSVRTVADVMGGGATAPTVAVTEPEPGATVPGRPQLSGTASGAGTVTVNLYQGTFTTTTPVATLTSAVSGGTWAVQPSTTLPDGTYTVQASQQDGTIGTSVPVTFTVDGSLALGDTTAPVVGVIEPTLGSTVTTPTPTIRGTGGTAAGDGGTVTVRIHAGSLPGETPEQTMTTTVGADGTWSVDASAMADGTYTVDAVQLDEAGNIGTSEAVTFTVDTTPVDITAPETAVTAPSDGSTVDSATPTVQGTASVGPGDDDEVSVAFYPSSDVDGDAVQTVSATVEAGGSWSATPSSPLAEGGYTVLATQLDAAGNIGTSEPVTFTITAGSTTPDTTTPDTTAPGVVVTGPVDGSSVTTTTPTVEGSAGTSAGDDPSVSVRIYTGAEATGSPQQTVSATVDIDGTWTATPTLADGTWTVQASQRDAAGNVGTSAAVTFSVSTGSTSPPPSDTTAPPPSDTTAPPPSDTTAPPPSDATAPLPTDTTAPATSTTSPTGSDAVTLPEEKQVTVTGLSPALLGRGARAVTVRVDGSGYDDSSAVAFSGRGVTAKLTGWTSTTLTLLVWVADDAPIGRRDVTVTNGDGAAATCDGCLKIARAPEITSVTPSRLEVGSRQRVVLRGTNFTRGTLVTLSGRGIEVLRTKFRSRTRMVIVLKVKQRAALTSRSLTLTDRRTQASCSLTKAFRVVS